MIKFGITEAGDAGIDLSWKDKLLDGNIIISKQLTLSNHKFIDAILENQDKIILHITCTGYGETRMEPHVPNMIRIHDAVLFLINKGFPVEQMVLRTDPIIPTDKGIQRVQAVWDLFKDTNITRVRYSIIDMYKHTQQRILETYGRLPFEGFKAPQYMIDNLLAVIDKYRDHYFFEACAENLPDQIGCISQKDFEILGLDISEIKQGGFQRKGCLCCSGKTELLDNKKRCPSGCLYCYWRD